MLMEIYSKKKKKISCCLVYELCCINKAALHCKCGPEERKSEISSLTINIMVIFNVKDTWNDVSNCRLQAHIVVTIMRLCSFF